MYTFMGWDRGCRLFVYCISKVPTFVGVEKDTSSCEAWGLRPVADQVVGMSAHSGNDTDLTTGYGTDDTRRKLAQVSLNAIADLKPEPLEMLIGAYKWNQVGKPKRKRWCHGALGQRDTSGSRQSPTRCC
mmetsp:Transcript_20876/g.42623  ORF Transcript_20876/g.42623 Transcript_20876/m.42623 type:complete len:130 (-) Transcript_20876:55-444(-)